MSNTTAIKAEGRTLLALGLPLIGSQVASFAVHSTDALMLGWYSVEALAQSALGGQIYFVCFILGSGFAWALLPMVAKAAEDRDVQTVRRVTRMGLWTSTFAGLAMMIPMWWSESLLLALGQKAENAAGAQVYLRIAGWGLIPFLWSQVLRSYLSALERTGIVFWVSIAVLVLNAAVNYLLIFGSFGFPELGIRGAAIASLGVAIGSFIGFAIYVQIKFPEHEMFVRFWRADWEAMKKLFALAIPISATGLAESGLFAAATFLLGMLGTAQVAAGNIVIQPAALAFMFHLGLSQASTVRAGQALSHNDREELRRIAMAGFVVSMAFGLLVVASFVLFRTQIVSAFLNFDDPMALDVLAIGVGLMIVAAAFQLVDAAQVLALGVLRGLQDTRVPMIMAVISYWIIGVPIAVGLGLYSPLGPYGVWIGLVSGLTTAAILLWLRYVRMEKTLG